MYIDKHLFEIDLLIILNDLDIESKLLNKQNDDDMKPLTPQQERRVNKGFFIIVLLLSFAQVINLIFKTL